MADKFNVTVRVRINTLNSLEKHSIGYGNAELLKKIDELHSLNKAAQSMGMAYSNAWNSINSLEKCFEVKLVERNVPKGSCLTAEGKKLLRLHENVQKAAQEAAEKVLRDADI